MERLLPWAAEQVRGSFNLQSIIVRTLRPLTNRAPGKKRSSSFAMLTVLSKRSNVQGLDCSRVLGDPKIRSLRASEDIVPGGKHLDSISQFKLLQDDSEALEI